MSIRSRRHGHSWDTSDLAVTVAPGSASTTTSVDHLGITPFDCLSWGAVVFSTEVQDTDGDGPGSDIWESSTSTLLDPTWPFRCEPNCLRCEPESQRSVCRNRFMHADAPTNVRRVLKAPAHAFARSCCA